MYVAFVDVTCARVGWMAAVSICDMAVTELIDYRYHPGKTSVSI